MMYIELTQGKRALVDDADHAALSEFKWYAAKRGYRFYAQRQSKQGLVHMHRLILGAPQGKDVDHINGNSLDNRRENIRIVSRSQNEWNRGKQKNNTTGYKGVILRKDTGHYVARIRVHTKLIYLGAFKKIEEAANAYNEAAKIYHGEFALLNTI